MDTENDDIRSLLEGALNETQGGEDTGLVAAETSSELVPEPDAGDASGTDGASNEGSAENAEPHSAARARDATGRFAKGAAAAKAVPAKEVTTSKGPAKAVAPAVAPESGRVAAAVSPPPVAPELKAPQSWKPLAREKWGAAPPEIQAEVARREREMSVAMQESSKARDFHQEMQSVFAPYMGMIQAEGGTPAKAVASLLQTAAALRTAPPAHRAELVANMCHTFGIPFDALDAALARRFGQPASQGQAQQHQQQMDPAAIAQQVEQQLMQKLQGQRTQATAQRAQTEVQQFISSGEAEFLDDVREEMADMMDLAARRGRPMTIKDAYTRAVQLHPELSEVLKQREAAKAAANANASTQRARAAASSVRSQPASPGSAKQPEDVRGALQAAIALHSRR